MEVDGRLEVLQVAEAVGHLLDRLDLGVEPLADGVRDAMRKVAEDVGERHCQLDEVSADLCPRKRPLALVQEAQVTAFQTLNARLRKNR